MTSKFKVVSDSEWEQIYRNIHEECRETIDNYVIRFIPYKKEKVISQYEKDKIIKFNKKIETYV